MRPALWCRPLLVSVLLHRCRPFLSCCSATCSSSATAPIVSIAIIFLLPRYPGCTNVIESCLNVDRGYAYAHAVPWN
ncbi:hypothetical protein PR003_g1522 [Phytophthora rubi]|uniref:Secreted protein n=1 Tax=Phytophthora rubi TaxID=129364 RepID=A0A6A3PA42_9STRA|nr:hypothetical protein PR002_g995 [Phytophthora rubi]KAE9051808.1 hypothetical protein PR001_g1105 [Phytophthora rubi]KAE9358015.1 hypothetical protein PR003_g1522 [Phytophthora rubi]